MGPSMTSKNLAMFVPRITGTIDKLVQLWRIKSEKLDKAESEKQWFDSKQDLTMTTTDMIAEIAFGESFKCLESAISAAKRKEPVVAEDGRSFVFSCRPPGEYEALVYLLNVSSSR